jgi:hypothetical protein
MFAISTDHAQTISADHMADHMHELKDTQNSYPSFFDAEYIRMARKLQFFNKNRAITYIKRSYP